MICNDVADRQDLTITLIGTKYTPGAIHHHQRVIEYFGLDL